MPNLRPSFTSNQNEPPVEVREDVQFEDVLEALKRHDRPHDEEYLRSIYEFSRDTHGDQVRRSGKPYFTHPLHVAYLLADLGFDETCVAVGLLHDVLEDTLAERQELAGRFGEELAQLVDGVTKIGRHSYVRRDQAQAETFRKLILASAKDIRVILVKLADRLHNMQTLEHMPSESRRRIARETLEIYAPTAHRLGMSKVQGDLQDLAFFHLHPQEYRELRSQIQQKVRHERQATEKIRSELVSLLSDAGLEAEISFRVKRFYSIYQKMRRQGIDASQLYDYLAFRIVTQSVRDCYASLGVVHQAWRPVPGRFKDYIAMPKPNLYQSLHTTLVSPSGEPFEVQIRTQEMDLIAEDGIAAHWRYKEGDPEPTETDQSFSWLRQLLEWQKDVQDPRTFLNSLKIDLYPDEVYVFTPKGDVFSFPRGATPLDFAYKIHTDLGHHCVGARINGKLEPLRSELKNGDIVEIVTNPSRYPSRDWLSFVATSRAKNKIRQWLNTEQKQRATEIGKRLVEKELKKHKVGMKRFLDSEGLAQYLTAEGIARTEDLFASVGYGKTSVRHLLNRVLTSDQLETVEQAPGPLRRAVTKILPFGSDAIAVKGQSDLLAYLAKCCSPVPGEPIVGYITRGRGVSVHSVECTNVQNLLYNQEREIEVEWARQGGELYPVVLVIETEDHPGMLARLTEVMAKHNSNIRQIEAETIESGRGLIEVVVEVQNRKHLERLRQSIRALPGVFEVGRRRGPGLMTDHGTG
jgi:guanosine-3',5'-bis(diphosphate) 3'-pyrophosphohydrolase